jgi:hypothetical protein
MIEIKSMLNDRKQVLLDRITFSRHVLCQLTTKTYEYISLYWYSVK